MNQEQYYKTVQEILSEANHKNFKDCQRIIDESSTIKDDDRCDFHICLCDNLLEEYGDMIMFFVESNE